MATKIISDDRDCEPPSFAQFWPVSMLGIFFARSISHFALPSLRLFRIRLPRGARNDSSWRRSLPIKSKRMVQPARQTHAGSPSPNNDDNWDPGAQSDCRKSGYERAYSLFVPHKRL